MPTVEEIVDQVGQCNVISKLDLSKGFHQVPVSEADKEKTTFVSHCGKFQYCRMPFGLRNAPAVFQQTMENALEGCQKFSRPYIDDIVVYSKCWSDHLVLVDRVLETLGRAGLTAKLLKCEWGGRKLVYLGHLVGSGTTDRCLPAWPGWSAECHAAWRRAPSGFLCSPATRGREELQCHGVRSPRSCVWCITLFPLCL